MTLPVLIPHAPSQPSLTALRVAVTIVHPVAILCTAFRLGYRWFRLSFWWDDVLACLSMVLDLICLIGVWMLTDTPWTGPLHQSLHARTVAYWLSSISFTSVLWTARLSILYSVIRITPPKMTLRRCTYLAVFLFLLMYAGVIVSKVYVCVHDPKWQQSPILQCHLGRGIAIAELTTDVVADIVLVAIPWVLLSRLRLPSAHRILLSTIFSASLVTTAVSIPHAVYVLGPEGLLSDITAHVEAGISLIVANMLVIVTYLYRVIKRGKDIDAPSVHPPCEPERVPLPPQPSWTRSIILNTYDLQQIGAGIEEAGTQHSGSAESQMNAATTMAEPSLRRDVFDDDHSHKGVMTIMTETRSSWRRKQG